MTLLRSIALVFTALALATVAVPVQAEDEIQVQPIQYIFNEEITFHVIFRSGTPVELAVIFFQGENDTQTVVELATVKDLGKGEYDIQYVHSLAKHRFQAFSNVEYRFEIMLKSGIFYKSPDFDFFYADNRFDWEPLQEGPFIVYWFVGDYAFAQSALDVAQEGLKHINGLLPLPAPHILHIYIYPDSKLLQDALKPTGEDWIAGHAFPDLQTMMLFLPPNPEQILDMRQRIPHEIMHIMLYQSTDLGYRNIPFWLNEGLASIAELYPNPDYQILLDNAVNKDSLLSMASLCDSFPRDASGALLAYAQSASFTQYLYDNFGTSGLEKLISDYANGMDCENGAKSALGIGLQQLERRWWRDSLSKNPVLSAIQKLLPWLTILFVVLITPLGFIIYNLRSKSREKIITSKQDQNTTLASE